MAQEKILISACLAGVACVYDGSHNRHTVFSRMRRDQKAILFCPEFLGD
ncbi:MAG: 2-thiouracil desulfurase family protein [Candidatus Omnitrophota bacterium]